MIKIKREMKRKKIVFVIKIDLKNATNAQNIQNKITSTIRNFTKSVRNGWKNPHFQKKT